DIYRKWIGALANDPHNAIAPNIAIVPFFGRIGFGPLGVALAATLAMSLAWICWKRKPDASTASAIAHGAWLLCSPLSWVHRTPHDQRESRNDYDRTRVQGGDQ